MAVAEEAVAVVTVGGGVVDETHPGEKESFRHRSF